MAHLIIVLPDGGNQAFVQPNHREELDGAIGEERVGGRVHHSSGLAHAVGNEAPGGWQAPGLEYVGGGEGSEGGKGRIRGGAVP